MAAHHWNSEIRMKNIWKAIDSHNKVQPPKRNRIKRLQQQVREPCPTDLLSPRFAIFETSECLENFEKKKIKCLDVLDN